MMPSIRIAAPAKVNLRLVVLARETSGFHSLETLFCGVGLYDYVEIRTGSQPGVRLRTVGDIDTGPPEQNLALRAAERFYEEARATPAVELRLEKNIPSAAGLGGGSSDAAATLRALNALHGHPLAADQLLQCGADLGSDVPFFLGDTPFAIAWARGGRMLTLKPPPPRAILIASPSVEMPTPAVYRRLGELRESWALQSPLSLRVEDLSRWAELERLAVNDFEAVARERIPSFDAAIASLASRGAHIALLSGSGSSIFGIFERTAAAEAAGADLERIGFRCWSCSTLERWPEPVRSIDPQGQIR